MKQKILVSTIVVCVLFLVGTVQPIFFSKNTITFYDIGQGDSIHIRTKSGFDMLIDAGPGAGTLVQKLSKDMPWYDGTIEILMPTHFDADHITGFSQVLDTYKVSEVILNDQVPETETAKKLIQKINDKHIPIQHMKEGQKMNLPADIELTFYNTQALEKDSSNDHSLVVRLTSPKNSFLLTGDLEQPGEERLLEEKVMLRANVLKAGHHGSKSSSSEPFLDAVNPTEAVLSFGEGNRYGHPHQETIEKLLQRHVRLRKTAEEGDIVYQL